MSPAGPPPWEGSPPGPSGPNKVINQAYEFLRSIFDTGSVSSSTFTTWSVAGAGASDVGVAGSVSIAVVDGDTSATIAKHTGSALGHDIHADGVLTVAAQSS